MKRPVEDGTARIVWVPSQQEWAATGYDGQPIGLFPTQMAAAKAIGGGFPDVLRAALMDEADAASRKTVHVAVPARFKPPAPPEPEPEPEPEPVPAPIAALPPPDPGSHVLAKIVDDDDEPETAVGGGGEAVAEGEPAAEAVEKIDTAALPVVHVSQGHVAEGKRPAMRKGKAKVTWCRKAWGWVATGGDGAQVGVFRTKRAAWDALASGDDAPAFAADGLHLNDAGYKHEAERHLADLLAAGEAIIAADTAWYWFDRRGWHWATDTVTGGPWPSFDEAVADRWRWLR